MDQDAVPDDAAGAAQEHSTLADEFLDAFNAEDWQRLRAVLAPDCVYEEIGRPKRRVVGADAIVKVFQVWAAAVPEADGQVIGRIAGPAGVGIEVEWMGAQIAPFGDFEPTGRRQAARGALFFYLEGDKISEFRHYYDSLVLFQVLGGSP